MSTIDSTDTEVSEIAELRRRLADAQATIADLRERESHLRMAMEASRVVAYRWDILNDRVRRLRSASEPGDGFEHPGGFEAIVQKVHPEDRERFRDDIAAALASSDDLYRTEVRYIDRAGVVHWVSESGRLQRDATGRPVQMVGVTFDITERKETEEALQKVEARLLELLATLQDQDRRKDEFLATLAHELRNPLAPIRNAFEILRHQGAAPADAPRLHAIIERQMNHLVRLVDDLLDVSRIGRGRLELRREKVALQDVAAQAIEAARPTIDANGHTLEIFLPPGESNVDGDSVRLVQAVLNLLTNAAKYTPRGGTIRLAMEAHDGSAVIRVSDNGIGMSTEQLNRVFEMFWQARGEIDSQGGLGIGLSLARTIVEMHGGRIEVRSDGPGRGSEFALSLPLAG